MLVMNVKRPTPDGYTFVAANLAEQYFAATHLPINMPLSMQQRPVTLLS
jgi:hypothetical protein